MSIIKQGCKAFFTSVCISAMALGQASSEISSPKTASDFKIAAVVNNHAITESDLEMRIRLILVLNNMPLTLPNMAQVRKEALETMVNEVLQEEEIKSAKMTLSDEELQGALIFFMEQRGQTLEGTLDKLRHHKIPEALLQEQVKKDVLWVKFVRHNIASNIMVADKDVKTRLEQQNKEGPIYLLREILIPVHTLAERETALKKLKQAHQELQMGTEFAEVAGRYSQAPSRATDGNIGWFALQDLEPALAKEIPDLTLGQTTALLDLGEGVGIYRLEDTTDPSQHQKEMVYTFYQLSYPLSPTLSDNAASKEMEKFGVVTQTVSSCEAFKSLESMKNVKVKKAEDIPHGNLPGALQNIFANLEDNEPSPPLRTPEGILMFMICERKEQDVKEMTKQVIRHALGDQRLGVLAQKYLQDLRRKAQVEIRR